jgi:Domain of unknown function (DUF4394)/Calx-beta domain
MSLGACSRRIALVVVCAGLMAASGAQAAPHTVTALGGGMSGNLLFQFTLSNPSSTVTTTPVTGLNAGDELAGIDYRPLDGTLYGVAVNGSDARVYSIVPTTGVATLTGGVTIPGIAGATAFGIDFNPISDRIRVISNLASDGAGANVNNFRLRADGGLVGVDTDLNFTGLPGGSGNAPAAALAFDRNVPGTPATTAFAIATGGDRLVRVGGVDGAPSSNGGVLGDVGPLGTGVNVSNAVGLDVDGQTGVAYGLLEVLGESRVYSVDLATGAVLPTALDNRVGDGVIPMISLAVPQRPQLSLANTAISVTEGDTTTVTVNRTGPLGQFATVGYSTDLTPATTATGADFSPSAGTLTFAPDAGAQTFTIATTEDAAVEPSETLQLRLSGATDATLSPDPLLDTLTIVDDDRAPIPAPTCTVSVRRRQPIDRSLAAVVSCGRAATVRLNLRTGRRLLGSAKVVLQGAGKRTLALRLSRKEVRLLKRAAKGRKHAKLRLGGSFAGVDATSSRTLRFKLG